jgi:hypothetical protein
MLVKDRQTGCVVFPSPSERDIIRWIVVQLNVAVEAQQELAEDKTESIMVQKTPKKFKENFDCSFVCSLLSLNNFHVEEGGGDGSFLWQCQVGL